MASSFVNRKAEEARKRKENESASGGTQQKQASSFVNRKADEAAAKNGAGVYTTYTENAEAARRNDRTGAKNTSSAKQNTLTPAQQRPMRAAEQLVNRHRNLVQDVQTEYNVSQASRKPETARNGVMDAAKRNSLYQSALSAAQTERAMAAKDAMEEYIANTPEKKREQAVKRVQAQRSGLRERQALTEEDSLNREPAQDRARITRANNPYKVGEVRESEVSNEALRQAYKEKYGEEAPEKGVESALKLGYVAAMYGLTQAGAGIAQGVDFMVGTPFRQLEEWGLDGAASKNPIVKATEWLNNKAQEDVESWVRPMEAYGAAEGAVASKFADIGKEVVANIPQAILGGMSAGIGAAGEAADIARRASGLNNLGYSIQQLAKNPSFYYTFLTEAGSNYQEALAAGASNDQATVAALTAGLTNAMVELGGNTGGGGLEGLLKKVNAGDSAFLSWVSSLPEEGAEEVLQGLVSRATAAAIYDKNAPVFGEGGIFDPAAAWDEFKGGVAVAGVLGGAQIGANSLLNSAYNRANAQTNADQSAAEQALEMLRQGLNENGEYQAPELTAPAVVAENATGAENAQVESPVFATENAQERTFAPAEETVSRETNGQWAAETQENTVRDAETIAQDVRMVSRAATTLGENGSAALRAVYSNESVNSEYSAEDVIQGFTALYNQAQGKKLSATAQARADTMPESVKNMAQSAGLEDARRARQAEYFGKDAGILRDDNLKKANLSYKTTRELDALGKALGVQVRFVDSIADDAGNRAQGEYRDGVISVALDSENPVQSVVMHEAVHRLREANTDSYRALAEFVQSHMSESGYDWNIRYTNELYGDSDIDAASEEVVADAFGTILNDSGLLQQFAREHTTVLQRIADSIRDTIRRVNRAVSMEDLQLTDSEKRRFSDLSNELAGMEKTMRNALRTVEKQWANKNTATEGGGNGVKYKLVGKNQDGIEVYETSDKILNMTWKDRKAKYLDVMKNEYRGKTAKFERNGHTYYATSDEDSIRKPIYGDKRASNNGVKALIKAGADGDVFSIVENSKYTGSETNHKNHTNADYFDYYVKTVQIDDKVFDLVADVEKTYGNNEGYIYTLALTDNKKMKASPAHGTPKTGPVKSAGNASVSFTVPQPPQTVKSKNKLAPKKSSTISEMEQSLNALNDEYRSLEKQDAEFQTAPEYTALMDAISEGRTQKRSLLDKPEALKQALDAYSAWQEESGYSDVIHRMEELRGEMKTLRGQLDSAKEQAAKEAKAATRAGYSESMAKDYATKAARKFGTTSNFDLAGYLTTNGTLLDFSDGQGYRVRDHREITDVLDFLPEDHGYSDGMIEFMNLGNIRLQSQGIDISKAPNSAQRSMLRKFFQSKNGDVVVDFSDVDGRSVGSLEYNRGTRADRILNDIDTYFETGVIPEQSVVSQFHSKFKLAAPTKDSNGKTLTEAQAEYFKDSKVRDENGNLRVVYHGTGADFTVFDKSKVGQNYSNRGGDLGFYFSPYIEDAQGYARENGGKRVEAVYLNLKNPLVVEDTGWGSAIGQADARHGDLMRWAKDGNHDGIIVKSLDEDMGNGEADTVYIAFEPEQIKRVSNQNPTNDPDIRYSRSNKAALEEFIRKYGEMPDAAEKAARALLKENEQLLEVNEGLKAQFKRTKLAKVDKRKLNSLTRQILKDYSSSVDVDDARTALDGLYTYLANGENGDSAVWEDAYERAYAVAETILENSSVTNDALYREYEALRKDIKDTVIAIDPDYVHDLGYESLAEFKKANRGKIRLNKNGVPIDTLYQSLTADYPGLFDAEVWNPADQLGQIEGVLNSLEPKTENPYASNLNEAASWLANDIIERFYELPQARPTYADKAARQLDREKIKSQQKLDNQKARYETRLEKKNQKIRDMIAENRQKVKDTITAERMAAGRQLSKQKQKYQERAAKASEGQKARVLRERIQRHTSELSRKLLNPSDKQHIPEQLRKPVAQLLEAIDLESKGGKPTARTLAFDELRRAYRDIIQNESSQVTVDPDMESNLDELLALKDMRISEMNSSELQTVWKVLKAMEYSISTAGKTLASSKYEQTAQWADALKEDTKTRKARRGKLAEVQLDVETPYTFFGQYGEAGKEIYRMLRNAQDSQTVMTNEVAAQVQEIVDEKTVNALNREAHQFTTEGGKKLTLTTAQIMDIYLLSKRQQALNHLLGGGIVQPDVKAKGAKAERGTSPVQLSLNDLSTITGTLTAEQKAIADKLQALTASTLAEYGNTASMKTYGYRKFTGADYWPIRSAGESLHYNAEGSGKNARSIKNIGLAKTVNQNANNPLNVGSVFDVLAEHAGNMIDYAAWLGPMEDANRLFNYRYQTEDGDAYVKSLLDRVGGKKSQAYWKNLMEDIQNGIKARSDSNIDRVLSKMVGNVKGARVGANLRVVVQQPTAFFRAMDTLSPLAMAEGMRMHGGWKKALKYSPIAQRKALGGFDISSPVQMNEILYGTSSRMQKFNNAMGWGAEQADAFTWGKLWNACEVQTEWNRSDLAPGTDEFYGAVNELFTEVIDSSQVVDGVLQRSQAMRSSSDTMKQVTAFMGEPIMSLNMMLRAVDNLRMETDSSKRGKALRGLGRAAASLAVTDIINALAQSLIDAARDDEDDPYWEKFWKAFGVIDKDSDNTVLENIYAAWLEGNLLGNMSMIGRMPVAKDLISIAQGYSVNRADADAIDDIFGAAKTLWNTMNGEGNRTMAYAVENFAKKVGAVLGISAPNLLRDVWSITRTMAQETGNIPLMYEMEKAIYKLDNSSNSNRFSEILYLAQQNDREDYDYILSDMAENGIDVNSIRKKVSNYIKNDNFDKKETTSLTVPQFSAYSSDVENEIQRLVEKTGDTSVSPGNAPKSFSVDGVEIELTQEEYDEYATARYNTYGELVGKMLKTKDYQQMDDEAKAKAVRIAASYANEIAKSEAVKNYSAAGWVEDAQEAQKKYSISPAQFVCLRSRTSGIKSLKDKNGDTIENSKSLLIMQEVYNTPGLNDEQRKAMFEYLGVGKSVRKYNKTLVNQKLEKMRKKAQ